MDSDNGDDSSFPQQDTLFSLLSNERRRHALECLTEFGPRISLADLADEVSVREHDYPIIDVPEDDVLAVYISLYHRHIPKLAAAGLVQYDQDRDLVRVSDDVKDVLDEIPEALVDQAHRE